MTSQKVEDRVKEDKVHLRRSIGLLPAVSFTIGTMVGSGIFIAPKGVHINTGSVGLSLVVWALCGLLSMLGALSYAELGTSFKKSGAHYTYILETLGPLPAFLRLWSEFIFIRPAVTAYIALAFGHYVVEPFFTPCPAPLPLVKVTSFLAMTFLVAVNCWSVSLASRTQVILLIVKISALVLIIIPGIMALAEGQTENFENAFNSESLTLKKLPLAFFSGFYAYSGWFALNFVTEEVINPKRNIPLAITLSMVTVTILYVLVNVAYYAVMTEDELLRSDAVAVTFTSKALPRMASLVPLLVALSCLGAMNGGIFSVPRMLLVAAREGQWPALFSMIHIRRKTPMPAVLLLSPLTVVMVAKGEIYELVNFASFSRWLFLALVTLGLVIHRYRFPDHPKAFKVPLAVPVTFTVVCFFIVGMSLYSDPLNTGCSLGVTFTGIPVYYLIVKHSYVPTRWRKAFDYCSRQLQIFLEVIQQEVQTY
ncbi:cystine/glutamate transporter-like isoform X2 [Tachysurus fulvidraco]|uniref:cystine/glutamate transporter-like isoform X2 n=1 Tax=Tachysurus fulvidraco TaxID=1234273 RepID=UPI001FED7198|nr:cystine/glutamate transporter-like isoform X2 [Tachysurus fulvidraco]XP_047659886.1 cystine/glutamate transporter-like isoform X2 [Tachysurus fulvidraco]